MKKVLLTAILACGVAFAAEANATAPKADANATKAEANATKADANATKADANATAAKGDAAAGKAKFAACAGCHGQNADKKALGKSEVIKGWPAAKIVDALKGYKAGTRNVHGMGATMKGQAAGLSDADMANIAAYVSSLK